MDHNLIVKNYIQINATPEKVWNVLTDPRYIRQWDKLPEDFGDDAVNAASVIDFPGYSKMKVSSFEPGKVIRYSLHISDTTLEIVPDLTYTYSINVDENGLTWLGIEIGDFSVLLDGEKLYDESTIFGKTASQKIKELAEQDTYSGSGIH
ncbi:MAG TPA: SRPBCC domain-containing protein [Flavobacterium sp.]|nr:SRPBCC domain-containing protein [Flavobacterium sp.]